MHLRELAPGEQLVDIIASSPLALLQFGTQSCAPCGALHQKIDSWLDEREKVPEHLPLAAVYISLDEHPALAAQADVLSAPTLRFYADGQLWAEAKGYFSLEQFLARAERAEQLLRRAEASRTS